MVIQRVPLFVGRYAGSRAVLLLLIRPPVAALAAPIFEISWL